jgi:hypothetical protein
MPCALATASPSRISPWLSEQFGMAADDADRLAGQRADRAGREVAQQFVPDLDADRLGDRRGESRAPRARPKSPGCGATWCRPARRRVNLLRVIGELRMTPGSITSLAELIMQPMTRS